MSFPFGGHPTLARFVEWALQNGCQAEIKVRTRNTGKAYESLEISNEHGAVVAIPNPNLQERLAPSMVAYLQRRLAIKTPFASTPEQPSSSS